MLGVQCVVMVEGEEVLLLLVVVVVVAARIHGSICHVLAWLECYFPQS